MPYNQCCMVMIFLSEWLLGLARVCVCTYHPLYGKPAVTIVIRPLIGLMEEQVMLYLVGACDITTSQ